MDSSNIDLSDVLGDDVLSALIQNRVLLVEEDVKALSDGLVAPCISAIGRSVADHELGSLPPATYCVFGVPLDTARVPPFSPFHGPGCIREAFAMHSIPLPRPTPLDLGNVINWPTDTLDTIGARIQWLTTRVSLAHSFPIMLGGDHAATYFAILGLASLFREIAVVQFDAHSDLAGPSQTRWCPPLNHASVMSHVLEIPNVLRLTQIGLRRRHEEGAPKTKAYTVQMFRHDTVEAVIASIPSMPIYVTVDLDVLDPKIAPEVTTPIAGGLSASEVKECLAQIFKSRQVVGIDFVEVCAGTGDDNLAARCAADLVNDVFHQVVLDELA